MKKKFVTDFNFEHFNKKVEFEMLEIKIGEKKIKQFIYIYW